MAGRARAESMASVLCHVVVKVAYGLEVLPAMLAWQNLEFK